MTDNDEQRKDYGETAMPEDSGREKLDQEKRLWELARRFQLTHIPEVAETWEKYGVELFERPQYVLLGVINSRFAGRLMGIVGFANNPVHAHIMRNRLRGVGAVTVVRTEFHPGPGKKFQLLQYLDKMLEKEWQDPSEEPARTIVKRPRTLRAEWRRRMGPCEPPLDVRERRETALGRAEVGFHPAGRATPRVRQSTCPRWTCAAVRSSPPPPAPARRPGGRGPTRYSRHRPGWGPLSPVPRGPVRFR